MPKVGLSDREWKIRLHNYASGSFRFGRGQKPRQGSRWAGELNRIDKCPCHGSVATHDPFGRPITCRCSYHIKAQDNTGRHVDQEPQVLCSQMDPLTTDAVHCAVNEPVSDVSQETTLKETTPSTADIDSLPAIDMIASSGVIITRHSTDFSSRLPQGWMQTVSPCDRKWIGKTVFVSKGNMNPRLQTWWHPPPPRYDCAPSLEHYFSRKLFLWMPRKMWLVDFFCPNCGREESLRSKGVYHLVRLVLDVAGMYYLAAEYMDCRSCKGTFIAWDSRILSQLSAGVRARFPAVLTRKYSCDWSVIGLLRSRTLGNSPTAMRNTLKELHSQKHLTHVIQYLSDCERYQKSLSVMSADVPQFPQVPDFPCFRTAKWFLAAYVRDVWSRLTQLKALVTSVFGRVLKIDSTKKVCKKLQGSAAHSASWATSLSNEKGEILMCVLTESEGTLGLQKMADGIIDRYSKAGQPAPVVMYTDRDCCTVNGPSKIGRLFSRWENLPCRLDVWHFMRRLARGITSESHPLYGTFMSRLSGCIFEWDIQDYQLLLSAKRSQLVERGIPSPSDTAVKKAVSKDEMASHCRQRTRGSEATVRAIEALLLSLSTATDSLGVKLLNDDISAIWEQQQKHIPCLQDPPGVPLYTVISELRKGKVMLPVLRCSRGTTSLESFHLHLARFIPGTVANSVNFQAYLVDGLARWNTNRSEKAIDVAEPTTLNTYDIKLKHSANKLCESLNLTAMFPSYREPREYTGELIGVEYLFAQTNDTLPTNNLENEIDEGFAGVDDEVDEIENEHEIKEHQLPVDVPLSEPNDDSSQQDYDGDAASDDDDEAVDLEGIPGWDAVDRLAEALISIPGLAVTNIQADRIISLYDALPEFDKRPVTFKLRTSSKKSTGFFGRSKSNRSDYLGVEMMKRCFLSAGSPASLPSKSRLVEAIFIQLTEKHQQAYSEIGADGRTVYVSRWRQVLEKYNRIRARVSNSQKLLEGTNLALFTINEATLTLWYKNTERRKEIQLLVQSVSLPSLSLCSSTSLPSIQHRSTQPIDLPLPHISFLAPEDTSGTAAVRHRKVPCTVQSPSSDSDKTTEEGDTVLEVLATAADGSRTTEWRNRATSNSALPPKAISRTTEWRRRKAGLEVAGLGKVKVRKLRSCTICNLPIGSDGHSQFKGKIYCPFEPGQMGKTEWLAIQNKKSKAKKDMLPL